jgi:hypothetical protein
MERNSNDNLNSSGLGATGGSSSSGAGPESGYESGSSTGGSGLGSGYGGGSGLGNSGSQGYGAGISGGSGHEGSASSTQSFGGSSGESFGSDADNLADKAKGGLKDAADKAKSGLGSAKERATELKATLADKLEAGAEKLRSHSQSGSYAGATGQGSVATDSGALGQVSDKLATGMKASADFLRNADLDNMKSGIEKQVRENPGRSLLIAAGLGYLLGKAFRK